MDVIQSPACQFKENKYLLKKLLTVIWCDNLRTPPLNHPIHKPGWVFFKNRCFRDFLGFSCIPIGLVCVSVNFRTIFSHFQPVFALFWPLLSEFLLIIMEILAGSILEKFATLAIMRPLGTPEILNLARICLKINKIGQNMAKNWQKTDKKSPNGGL